MKYLFHNDISYLVRKKRIILISVLFLPLLILLLNLGTQYNINDKIMFCTGTNLEINTIDIIQLLMYLFNLYSFIYLMVDIYMKDLNDNLENIFLRMKPWEYIVKKNIYFTITIILIKVLQYSIMFIILILYGNSGTIGNTIFLLLTDAIYILFSQYLYLLIYLIYILLKKNICFLTAMSILLILLIPKNIWSISNYILYVILLIIIIQTIISLIFYKKSKRIIEYI